MILGLIVLGAKCSKSRDLVRLRFAIRIANRKSLAIWRARRCDSAAIWKRLQITNRAIWTSIWSVFDSDLGDILAIWTPRFKITSDLRFVILVAPYCAIPRDYLSDTPLLRAMGFLVSQHGRLGAIPPPPFLSVSPLKSSRRGGAIPPPLKRGISAILARYPMKTRQMGAIPPSAILSRKGIARYGGVSRTGPFAICDLEHLDWGLQRCLPCPSRKSGVLLCLFHPYSACLLCEWGRQLQSQNSKIIKVTQKWLKSDFSGSAWKWLENGTKVTQKWLFGSFLTRKSHFWVTFVPLSSHFQADPEKSLFSHFWVTLIIFEFWLCSCRPHSQCLLVSEGLNSHLGNPENSRQCLLGGRPRPPRYMRENGTISPFGVFPQFYSIFRVKIGHFPLKRVERTIFGGRKGQMVSLGFQDP